MSKIGIIGAGAIGGTMAAWLAQDPQHEITLCVRSRFHELVVDTPTGRLTARLPVLDRPNEATPVEWILVATKAYHVLETAAWFPRLLGPTTRVAVLQNGVEHLERFAPFVDRARILPVIVDCPVERAAPGRILQRREALLTIPATNVGQSFRELFVHTRIQVLMTDDFLSAAWTKLCLNSVGAVSAVAGQPAKVIQVPGIAELMRQIAHECVAVARAEGARVPDHLVASVLENCREAPPDSVNSLLADRLAGRPMEIDARNGAIVRRGADHGIPTPFNAAMVALLNAIGN